MFNFRVADDPPEDAAGNSLGAVESLCLHTAKGHDRMSPMGPELGLLVVQIVRWVDDGFPGVVACEFVDAYKRVHTLIDKVPMVTREDLDATSIYPQRGGVRCTVLERWRELRAEEVGELVRVYIGYPDAM